MSEDPPTQAHPSISNPNQSQRIRYNETSTSSRGKVVTRPPWAKDEPPSPTDSQYEPSLPGRSRGPSDASRSDASQNSLIGQRGEHRWFPFTRRHPMPPSEVSRAESPPVRLEKRSSILRSSSFNAAGFGRREDHSPALDEKSQELAHSRARDRSLRIALPATPATPYSLSHGRTPGWDSPWAASARPLDSLPRGDVYEQLQSGESPERQPHDEGTVDESWWPRARKRARAYLLNNVYAPLLFRFINITFTTAALAVAIQIRTAEKHSHSYGILGSSSTLVIIFAPLTLVHVMVAIYLEYFGRPLGLWRTSSKLAHTLLEVLFICAWSAALSLCCDNYFTSPIPCASASDISWYSQLPRPPSPLGGDDEKAGKSLCEHQMALIILVGIGLLMYCFNLVISLYRIFEKVKHHHKSVWGGP
ncbi:hypothetical protein F5148DRAFT_341572 [Russula earlei]|uniref:Uncharacterized protein n=1 Tax=Russula earlei TaxID=71964 RepID=A0ACC0U1G4_9AGAM|nr:hypothetical protein F5148DRAFT_341572 [Russula earlei]